MSFEEMINTIQLGNCYELLKKIPDKSIDCVYVDVPYLYLQHGGGQGDLAQRSAKQFMELLGSKNEFSPNKRPNENLRIAYNKIKHNEEMNRPYHTLTQNNQKDIMYFNIVSGFDYKEFIKEAFRVMKIPNIFIWCSPMQLLDIMNEIKKYCDNTPTILVWGKTNPIPTTNNNWLSDLEYCIYVRGKGIVLNNRYELKSKWYISPINQQDKKHWNHPTIKPLELVKRHILHATQENDIVLDCFCGSGTTCVASKETNRRFIGMEIDENYYKTACNRLNGIDDNGQLSIFSDFD